MRLFDPTVVAISAFLEVDNTSRGVAQVVISGLAVTRPEQRGGIVLRG
jgi:hypothetical protein